MATSFDGAWWSFHDQKTCPICNPFAAIKSDATLASEVRAAQAALAAAVFAARAAGLKVDYTVETVSGGGRALAVPGTFRLEKISRVTTCEVEV